MNTQLLKIVDKYRHKAIKQVNIALTAGGVDHVDSNIDVEMIERTAYGLQLVVLDILLEYTEDVEEKIILKQASADAFRLFQVLPVPRDSLQAGEHCLRVGILAILGDKDSDAVYWLSEVGWPTLPTNDADWRRRTWATVLDVWLRLIYDNQWFDCGAVLKQIDDLRGSQLQFERGYLEQLDAADAKYAALELIGLYHLARIAEILAQYLADSVSVEKIETQQLIKELFDSVLAVCNTSMMVDLELLCRLLPCCTLRMMNGKSRF